MKILMIASNDPAGMAMRFTNAVNRYTEHRARCLVFDRNYGNFEYDLCASELDPDYGEVEALLRESDVIHFHNLVDENWPIGPLVIRDYVRGKLLVYHEHGHPYFLANAPAMREKSRKAGHRVLVATPDLLKLWPGAAWLPNLVPIHDPAYLPRPESVTRDSGLGTRDSIRICQAPTRKWHKNHREFLEVTDDLMRRHPNVERVIVEKKPYAECLRIKRTCDVVFDHLQGHFGISSLESLCHGVPVVAGLDDWNIAKILEATGAPDHPWVIARDKPALARALEALVADPALRREIGAKSRAWMETHWPERRWVEKLIGFYEDSSESETQNPHLPTGEAAELRGPRPESGIRTAGRREKGWVPSSGFTKS